MSRSLRYLSIRTCDTPVGVRVHLAGVADSAVCDQLDGALAEVLHRRPGLVDIDATDLRLLDCAALSVLIRMQRRAREYGADLCLSNTHGGVARVLRILDLTAALTEPDWWPSSLAATGD